MGFVRGISVPSFLVVMAKLVFSSYSAFGFVAQGVVCCFMFVVCSQLLMLH